MPELYDSIQTIRGIGEKKALAFARLGVNTLYDLIAFFPRRYEDRTSSVSIAEAQDGQSVCITAVVADEPRLSRVRKGMELVKFKAVDESGVLDVTYFNQSWMKDHLSRGDEVTFFGKVEVTGRRRSMVNPVFDKAGSEKGVTGCIVPVYRLTSGLSQKTVLQSVRIGLECCASQMPDFLPDEVVARRKLARSAYAYENIHCPKDFTALELARRRLIFEELFVLACALGKMRGDRTRESGCRFAIPPREEFLASLPFTPTNAQMRAIRDAEQDLSSGFCMSRLVQGDVGSGKTLVAAACAWIAVKNGKTVAFMAPTEILAEQHVQTLSSFLGPLGVRIGKLTGSMTAKEKRLTREAILRGELDVIVGTHALFTDGVEYPSLGLVITDEQHRFGVAQRSALIGKGERPHVLVMSATPIPRTLALIIYGDLDVSIIDELPPGRQKVDTFRVDSSYRARLNSFIVKQAAEGHQTFVVCPMVEENEESPLELKSAEEHARELQALLPELRVSCVHGKMKPKEKDALMAAFAAGEADVLVSTTVIEVGVDVPNATLMVIENAERFGLSQLHQLRGRVGRGKAKSWCILVSDADGEDVRSRLDILCKTNDGFRISEEDLRLRGPGDFFGSRQHGLPEMHAADLGANTDVLKAAKEEATLLLSEDPSLEAHPVLRARIDRLFASGESTFN